VIARAVAVALVLAAASLSGGNPLNVTAAQPAAHPDLLWERNISPETADEPFPYDYNFDPIVATHPTDPKRIAVSYHTLRNDSGISCTRLVAGLRITDDGGETWHEAGGMPWEGTGRAPNWHAAIAWGPGPTPESPARLYWVDTTMPGCDYERHRVSVAYSDDEGETWSKLFTYRHTPETLGGYPDITVDRNPSSPNYGMVYAAINWITNSSTEPGLRLLASYDFGDHWKAVEIPPVEGLDSYPFKYRIGYRLRTSPDGSVYVGFCQYDMRNAAGYYGRLGFGLSRVMFDRTTNTFDVGPPHMVRSTPINHWSIGGTGAPGSTDPRRIAVKWTYGLDVDPANGQVFMALPAYISGASGGAPRGRTYVGRSKDGGTTWSWTEVPWLPKVDGRPQSQHKPTLTVRNKRVFVGVHGLVDVPYGTNPRAGRATIGNYYAVSYTRGKAFTAPQPLSDTRWDLEALSVPSSRTDVTRNRAGLRDRAEFTAAGDVVYVYADGRLAKPEPDESAGRGQIFAALISLNGGL
jgi:hypothetical protein